MGNMRSGLLLPPLLFLASAFIPIAAPQSGVKPKVVATDPANGATGVSRVKSCGSFTFDVAMDTSVCGVGSNLPLGPGSGGSCSWSTDRKTMTVCRPDAASNPLAYGFQAVVFL